MDVASQELAGQTKKICWICFSSPPKSSFICVSNCGSATRMALQIPASFSSDCPNSSLDSGGTVHRSDGISRVDSGLAVSRALGDFSYKDAGVADADRKISATPEVTTVKLRPGDEFAILATDGVWDVSSCPSFSPSKAPPHSTDSRSFCRHSQLLQFFFRTHSFHGEESSTLNETYVNYRQTFLFYETC